jgi:thiol-disulfide isomerase/thioredoxin
MTVSNLLAAAFALALGAAGLNTAAVADDRNPRDTRIEFAEVSGQAPDFKGITTWLNSGPLTMSDLRGKVVMVNFWTYGCYNCVNTLPHVTRLHAKYKDKGLVIIGVHTPEFPFEKSTSNVQAALKRHGILYPVAQDNESSTWSAYGNRYWPAQYIVDQGGKIVYLHAGEGAYDEIERTIQNLLKVSS